MVKQVAIIGGGIIGATAAFYLSYLQGNENVQVTLFDDDHGQATKAASGIISPWLSKRRNKRWYALAKRGAELYSDLVKAAQLSDKAYQQTGTIVTRKNHEDLLSLYHDAQIKQQQTPAMGHVELLDADAVQKKMPLLTNPPEGIFVSGGARIDGADFVKELLEHAEANNVQVKHERVSVLPNGDVRSSEGTQTFDHVIVATGAWMHETLEPLGLNVKVRPQKGQLIDLTVAMPSKWRNMPVMMPESMSDIIPFNGGKLVIGATHENDEGFDLTPKPAARNQLFENAKAFISTLSESQITDMRVGTRAYTGDFAPFFGALPDLPSFLVGGGLGSSGLTTGPIIGYFLAQAVLGDHSDDWSRYTKPVSSYIG
jgi:glycine/D-amino acid oxidase-like deaminating enzyme